MNRLWRPFSAPGARPATMIEAGDGAYVIDADGRRYLDAAGGLWNVSLGLGNAALVSDVRKQLETLAFASLFHGSHRAAEALSDKLVALSAGRIGQVYLSTTGSSAVEVAVQVARLYHRARHQTPSAASSVSTWPTMAAPRWRARPVASSTSNWANRSRCCPSSSTSPRRSTRPRRWPPCALIWRAMGHRWQRC